MKTTITQRAGVSLLAVLVAGAAHAQQGLPTIDVGAAPLRSSSQPAPRTEPAVNAGPAANQRTTAAPPSPPSAEPAPALPVTPAAVNVTTAKEIAETRQFDLATALERVAPGVVINDVNGNPFEPEVDFRGFVASPVSGTPEGLAVYMSGVRINEAFGDTVNWDLIPSVAIERTAIVTANPLFGLNAIGGAVVLDMKNGFTYHGFEIDGRGGSFSRHQGSLQYGVEKDGFAAYLALEAAGDQGYRKFSGSQIERLYGDLGWRGDNNAEIHATTNIAQNRFGVSGPAPIDLVNVDPSSVWTTPQTNKNSLSQFGLNGSITPAQNWKLLADVHYRAFDQAHNDGNTTDFVSCGAATLCDGNGNLTYMPDVFGPNIPIGVIDRTWTRSRTIGGTVQVENTEKVFGRPNTATFGVSLDHGWTHFSASEELGWLNPYDLTTVGLGIIDVDPSNDVAPVKLNTANTYLGVYARDQLEVTDQLTFTAGARYNYALIALYDQYSNQLNGNSVYTHVNPMVGATYKLTPDLAAYASYSESNRAPTPLELGCANPSQPCLIDNFLVSDPPLKQVVGHTIETGLRGDFKLGDHVPEAKIYLPGRLDWSAGVFRTTSFDDILSVPSEIPGLGYFKNAGTTQRQGVETQLRYTDERLSAYINYTLTDATFRSTIMLGSPYNPEAIAFGSGNELITPGAHMTSVPKNRLKAGFDYALTKEWKIGADVIYVSGNWIRGDEINAYGTLPAYAKLNLRSSYQLTENLQIYGLIENVTNTRAEQFATFFGTTSAASSSAQFLSFTSPTQVSISAPIGFFAGVKATF